MNVNSLTVPNSLLRCFWHTTRLLFRHTVCSLIPTSSISVSKISWNWLVAWWIVCMQNVSKRRWLTSLISFPKYQGIPCVTDCVMAELEKLGHRFRIALRWVRCHGACIKKKLILHLHSVARDPRFERLRCSHTGTYADDCLVQRVTAHKCFIVATCDRELRRRIRQIPGVPLMYIANRRYAIERLPDQGAPSWNFLSTI